MRLFFFDDEGSVDSDELAVLIEEVDASSGRLVCAVNVPGFDDLSVGVKQGNRTLDADRVGLKALNFLSAAVEGSENPDDDERQKDGSADFE
jgi:hypothetical protein